MNNPGIIVWTMIGFVLVVAVLCVGVVALRNIGVSLQTISSTLSEIKQRLDSKQ